MASVSTQVTNRDSSLLKVKTSWAEPKLEHTVASSYPNRSPRLGPPGVIARLQALFPPSPTVSHDAVALPSPSSPDFIKIRIITWNMHDSLPKVRLKVMSCSSVLAKGNIEGKLGGTFGLCAIIYPKVDHQ